jgi:hypothetical protein
MLFAMKGRVIVSILAEHVSREDRRPAQATRPYTFESVLSRTTLNACYDPTSTHNKPFSLVSPVPVDFETLPHILAVGRGLFCHRHSQNYCWLC